MDENPSKFWNPYVGGVLLDLVLLTTGFIALKANV